jgi:hypothetical protein
VAYFAAERLGFPVKKGSLLAASTLAAETREKENKPEPEILVMSFLISTSTYLTADQNWIAGFYQKTQLSNSEISRLVEGLPAVLTSKAPCTFESAGLALRVFADLNVKYLHEMLDRGDVLMSIWSLRSFHSRNYVRFMESVAESLDKSLKTQVPVSSLGRKVAENASLHVVNQLQFPLEATKGIERPQARDIDEAFEAVKRAISSKSAVDKASKQLVVQATGYDVKSLEYMDRIAGLGPLSVFSDRLFRLYKNTLALVAALPEI